MHAQLSTSEWLKLSSSIRVALAALFGIKRSEGSFIQSNKVISDGYTYNDLSVITVPVLQAYLLDTHETDFYKLFERVVAILSTQNTTVEEARSQAHRSELLMNWTKTIEEVKKEADEENMADDFSKLIVTIFVSDGDYQVPSTTFCNSCDSRGVRHKKDCKRALL